MEFTKTNNYTLYHGKMQEELLNLSGNSIDCIVTDPPYELNFMSKGWDNSGVSFQKETWEHCYRVLKPGGYLLAFGGPRTYHRICCAIEDAGFEIRDCIMWLYGSGFPKSMNIGLALDKRNGIENHAIRESENKWNGWGTALKPAYEPIVVARKPLKGSLLDNITKNNIGGFNIDECRIPAKKGEYDIRHYTNEDCFQNLKPKISKFQVKEQPDGRFPANIILTYDETDKEEVCGNMPNTGSENNKEPYNYAGKEYNNKETSMFNGDKPQAPSNYNDNDNGNGSAARYFYCAKATKKDKEAGLDGFNAYKVNDNRTALVDNPYQRGESIRKNTHPTVKPTSLMQYLVRLVAPKGATILDPFMGSGSTGKAVMFENKERNANYKFIGIEMTDEYLPIAQARIEWASRYTETDEPKVSKKSQEDIKEEIKLKTRLW